MGARRRGVLTALISGFGLALAGCVSAPSEPSTDVPQYHRDLVDQVLAEPGVSDFVREVLSDYRVTDAEYTEARERFAQCMADEGWEVTYPSDMGGYTVTSLAGVHGDDEPDTFASLRCGPGTLDGIDMIYLEMRDNPAGLTPAEMVRNCYQERGIPDGEGLSLDAFEQLVFSLDYQPSSAEAFRCWMDPDGRYGITLEMAEEMLASSQTGTIGEGPGECQEVCEGEICLTQCSAAP